MWIFPVAGLLSLIWFLIRVVPKPSRAVYPCQRVAFPLASGFVAWLLGLAGSAAAFRKAKHNFARRRYMVGLIFIGVSIWVLLLAISATSDKSAIAEPQPANKPIGVAQGIHPGRVVWVHNPEVTDWEGPGDGHWWESSHTNQAVVDQMMSQAICELTGQASDAAAWDKIFRYFNNIHGKDDVGYKPGEKIVIKVNFVGFIWTSGGVNPDNYNLESKRDYMNTSPQMIIALLRQLVNTVGVNQADVAICDSLSYFANEYYDILHKEFPDVRCLDHAGNFGRIKMELSSIPLYWSCRPEGCLQDYVPVSFAEADYLINFANLKAHTGAGVTLCAKNHYGSLIRWPAQKGYYDLHKSGFSKEVGVYRNLVDLMGHAHIGGKTVLYLIDGLYCGVHPTDMPKGPRRWKSDPFNGDWTSSLFASQDPVAIDSVGFDFLHTEYEDHPRKSGVDDYLHEAALANAPASGTFYDPDHSGNVARLASLGVHEHWNNPKDKKYSRNLGTGNGIELVTLAPKAVADHVIQTWGRVEGTVLIGNKPGANEEIWLHPFEVESGNIPQGTNEFNATAESNGRFVFDRVPVGWAHIGRLTRMGEASWSLTNRVAIEIERGQTNSVTIGGTGRPITGKFVTPKDYNEPIDFGHGLRVLSTFRPEPPHPENYDRMTKREQTAWISAWGKTPEGRAFYRNHQIQEQQFIFKINKDGTFRIEDVPAGKYQFHVWVEEAPWEANGMPEEIAFYGSVVEVAEMPGGRSDEPLDLGELPLTMRPRLHIGDVAPAFDVQTLEGKSLRMADYRGKFVLLSFWAPYFDPEKSVLEELNASYGKDGRLAIVGFAVNDTLEQVKKYAAENDLKWPQVFLGKQSESTLVRDYGAWELPSIFLVGPDGKIVDKHLRGERLKSAVAEALAQTKGTLKSERRYK